MTRIAAAASFALVVSTSSAVASGWSKPSQQGFPDSVVAHVPVGGDPHDITGLPDGSYLYIGNETDDHVTVVRTADRTVVARLTCGAAPWVVLSDPAGDRVYVANLNSNSVSVIRTSDNAVVATVPVGASPCLMACRPQGDFVYVPNSASNNVSVIRTSDNQVVATVGVGGNPRAVACLPDGNYVYTANYLGGDVSVIRTSDNTVVATVPFSGAPHRICAVGDGSRVYVTDYGGDKVYVIRTSDNALVDSFVSGPSTVGMAMFPASEYAYVVNSGDNTVSVVQTSADSLITTIPTGHAPWGVTAPAARDFVYTVDRYGQSVTVIGYRRQHDVCPVRILAPTGVVDSGAVVQPRVLVKNFGTSADIFPVTMRIGSGYTGTAQDTLPAGFSDTVQFPAWTAWPLGTLPVTCFTGLTGDENPANDTITDSVRVARSLNLDVGPVEILSPPGTPESGRVYLPSAIIRNFGETPATFPVTMTVGTDYAETAQETLASGLADTVVFPSWIAEPVGSLAVTCFTALVGDEDPANDTIRDSVRVVGSPMHDVGAVAIVVPTGTVHTGDTVTPRARIKNFGNTAERFFDVRFRIGTSYNRTANATQTLYPDSVVELTFAPWVAASGTWAVSCSTMLASDANRANDKVTSTVRAFAQLLHIEPDQSDQIEVGEGKTYRFYALIEGDTGGVVEVVPPTAPTGWGARLCDATGANDLTDTDGDGTPDLGFLEPGVQRVFSLEVMTPSGLAGDTATLTQKTFVIAGHMGNDSTVDDTALLNLTLVPGFSVHNFPNPLSSSTAFVIGLPADGKVSLTVYTRAGERVCRVIDREDEPTGIHVVRWDAVNDNGRGVAPGTYEYVLDYVHQGKTDRIRKRLVVTRE
jgi:YVTN family beta-propeller protein